MSGIVFFQTRKLDELKHFYQNFVHCNLWLDQGKCAILQHGNFLVGFCASNNAEISGCITFFYPASTDVDKMYTIMKNSADGPPRTNDQFQIYQFFARDPENRILEFQYFQHQVHRHMIASELLMRRRSVRNFSQVSVPDTILNNILDISRYAPTSMNSQSYYFKCVSTQTDLQWLAAVRGAPSAPLGRAPVAVAIAADPDKTKRPDQDADIAAYHFMLAATHYGLGTCWIAAMNRDDVKDRLNIPRHFYLSTVTPLGWPKHPENTLPLRRTVQELLLTDN
jgi:nitroreductase